MNLWLRKFVHFFPWWLLLFTAASLMHPPLATWFSGPLITIGLAVIMLGMGLSLELSDFLRVLRMPKSVGVGVLLQFLLMPGLGWLLSRVFSLPPFYAAGLVLVSCCPGGTASNVIAFLAKADVALSVTLTAVSTMVAVALTPLLSSLLIGSEVAVDGVGLFISTAKVVLLPVALGLWLRKTMPRVTELLLPWAPPLAVVMIVLIVASIIAAAKTELAQLIYSLAGAVLSLHLLGFFLGYVLAKCFAASTTEARTISIEVGMQNSGLGVVLARSNFSSPLVAIPAALSSLTHCVVGSLCAAFWARRAPANKEL
ncbi:MAG: bile acid:sodium symporter family protein [Myxococcales bacterium]|nr:MAG: bile acid:sodium symporter family protein [Myxococcales bacterium]